MGLPSSHQVTCLLKAWRGGHEEALEKLTPLVYGVRAIARDRAGATWRTLRPHAANHSTG
jgi:hypothetical protein